ncbi:MAG: VacJ family lipoprotein [Desulfovibrionaceae bacterium]|nr:VacJ family lipoprotein [Desulfovibrionaceae bacterium]
MKKCCVILAFAMILLLCGCAKQQPVELSADQIQNSTDLTDFEDYEEFDTTQPAVSDPLESWNRFWFKTNDVLLLKIIKPIHAGYSAAVPWEFRAMLKNFFHNLLTPLRVVNALLQGYPAQAFAELQKCIVNTTAGFGGFADLTRNTILKASQSPRELDFGSTLASWGIGEGIYLVWPLLGPSTLRDTAGMTVDWALSPLFWCQHWSAWGIAGELRFNEIDSTVNTYEQVVSGAVEPYSAIRDAYISHRRYLRPEPSRSTDSPESF